MSASDLGRFSLPFFTVSEDFRIVEANRPFLEILGAEKDEIKGRRCHEVVLKKPEPIEECPLRDKREFPSFLIHSLGNNTYLSIINSVDRRLFLEIWIRIEDIFIRLERVFSGLLESLGLLVYQATPEGKLIYISQGFSKVIGYGMDELMNMNIRDLYWDPKDRERFRREIETQGFVKGYTIKLRRKDNLPVWMDVYGRVVRGEKGKPIRYEGVLIDVTKKVAYEEELRKLQKFDLVGKLVSGIAHSFNNALTVIQGSVDAMKAASHDESLDRWLKRIEKSVEKASFLVDKMLSFAQRRPLGIVRVNVNRQISDLVRILKGVLREDIQLELDLQEKIHPIEVDPVSLEQIILNLINNARDAMPEGGKITISTRNVELVDKGDFVRISVEDTGIGMTKDVMDRIFDPFFTTKEPGEAIGLGLPTVYMLVKQQGGFITVDSKVGEGSRFDIYFPAIKSEDQGDEKKKIKKAKELPKNLKRVLVAEDEDEIRSIIKDPLTLSGIEVIEAKDGYEAFEKFLERGGEIDLVITDVIMPRMSGKNLFEKIRKINPDCKFIFISGYDPDVEEFSPEGGVFLPKPFTISKLFDAIKSVLEEKA